VVAVRSLLPDFLVNLSYGAASAAIVGTPLVHFATAVLASEMTTLSAQIPLKLADPSYPVVKKPVPVKVIVALSVRTTAVTAGMAAPAT
jgi:hypothetical protein